MTLAETNHTLSEISPLALVCEEDAQEKHFDTLVKLWVDDEISYEYLMNNYPDYDMSMLKKALRFLSSLIE